MKRPRQIYSRSLLYLINIWRKYMIKFHEVIEPMRRIEGSATLPTRATRKSGAYDFYAKTNYTVKPNEIVKIWDN